MRDANIKGGSGYAAATVGDMGFAQTNGVVGSGLSESSVIEANTRKRKTKKESEKEGGAMLSLANISTDPRGDPPIAVAIEKTAPTTNPEQKQPVRQRKKKLLAIEGGAAPAPKRVNKYALLVKEVMAKNSIKSLAEASTHP